MYSKKLKTYSVPAMIRVGLRLNTSRSLTIDMGAPPVDPSFIKVSAVVVIATYSNRSMCSVTSTLYPKNHFSI